LHPAIDACRQLRDEYALQPEAIESIQLRVHPLVLTLTGKTAPRSGLEGKFSVYHAAAVSVITGEAGPREFTDEIVRRGDVIALRDTVSAHVDATLSEEQAGVVIVLKNGRRLERFVLHAVGSISNPMSDNDLDRKFRGLAAGILPEAQVTRLMGLCRSIANAPRAADVSLASVPAA